MKLFSLVAALVVPWVFAPGTVPLQDPPICNYCVDIGGGWTVSPEVCRSVTDTLTCTTVASGCSVTGSLTVDSTCAGDSCLFMASVTSAPPTCGLNDNSTTQNPYSPPATPVNAQFIACLGYPGCIRVVGVHFISTSDCSLGNIVATYSHPFQCQ